MGRSGWSCSGAPGLQFRRQRAAIRATPGSDRRHAEKDEPMHKLTDLNPETRSADATGANIERLKALFPAAVKDQQVDFAVLRQLLGDATEDHQERFGLSWHGKDQARQLALSPSSGTLRPRPDDSLDWDSTANLVLEGDNLEVLKLLQNSFGGKVRLIYIDPPYNTGRDFVYRDAYKDSIQNYLEMTGQVEAGRRTSSHQESGGRLHTDWLNMMYPRLRLARELLREDGIICISIDDGEAPYLRVMADEIFGAENFICVFVWKSKSGGANDSRHVAVDHEYLVTYGRDAEAAVFNRDTAAQVSTVYNRSDEKGEYALDRLDKQNLGYSERLDFPIVGPDGTTYRVRHRNSQQKVARWRWSRETVARRYDELVFRNGCVYTRNYRKDGAVPRSLLVDERFGRTRSGKTELTQLMTEQVFDNPKPTRLIGHLIDIATGAADIVLDFFAGSGTTAHAVMQRNAATGSQRRFILVQLPEPLSPDSRHTRAAAAYCDRIGRPRTIAALTRERLHRAAATIRAQHPVSDVDLGFRAFRLDDSNIRTWDAAAQDLEQELADAVDRVKPGRSEADLLYELVLEFGLDLGAPVARRCISGKQVHAAGDGTLLVCLDPAVNQADAVKLAHGIAAWRRELAPAGDTTCVFRDSACVDDAARINLSSILRQQGIARVYSI